MTTPNHISELVFKTKKKTFLFALLSCVFLLLQNGETSAKDADVPHSGSYIVKLKSDVDVSTIAAISKTESVFGTLFHNANDGLLKVNGNSSSLERYYIVKGTDSLSFAELSELQRNSEVFEPNYLYSVEEAEGTPNDPLYSSQWGLFAIEAEKAWQIATGKGIVVGVVDTGIDFYHEDLLSALSVNAMEDINGNGQFDPWLYTDTVNGVAGDIDGIDNDGNGLTDDVVGYDFVDQRVQSSGDYASHDAIPYDENGHGTMVTGVIAATANNGKGVAGIARDAKVIMARSFDINGQGESDDIAKAIIYLVGRGVKVINLSFGESFYSHLVAEAIDYAVACGITVVASSGNNGWAYPHYPSDLQNVISVGNVAKYGEKYSRYYSSSYGYNLSLLAPGTGIYTCCVGDNYKSSGGTSLSAPAVTACAAMLLEQNKSLTSAQIRSIIETNATPISSTARNATEGAGLLNIYKSLLYSEPAELSISSPVEFEVFHSEKDSAITVIGTAIAPLFDSLVVSVKDLAASGDTLYKPVVVNRQVKNDTIAVFKNLGRSKLYYSDGSEYEAENGQMLIKLDMALKNGKTIGKTLVIEVLNEDEQLLIDSASVSSIINLDKVSAMVGVETNMYSFATAEIYLNGELAGVKSDNDLYSRYHSILLDNLISENEYKIVIKASRRDGEKVETEIDFSTDTVRNLASFKDLNPAGLSCGGYMVEAKGMGGEGNSKILLCTFDESGNYDASKLLTFTDGGFTVTDSNSYPYLPVAVGNIRGGGVNDVLMKESAMFYLLDYSDGKLFANRYYADVEKYRTGLALFDFDNDGRDEVLSYSDTCFYIDKYIDNSLQTISQSNDAIYIGAMPGVAIGDFDNDGNVEFAHSDRYGNLYIEEYRSETKSITREAYIKINNYNDIDYHYLTAGDFDNDGKKEIAFLYSEDFYTEGNYSYGAESEPKEVIWKLRIYKAEATGKYNELTQLACDFADAKFGSGGAFLRHGLSAGNVDNESGDELVLSLYPNVYVMKNYNNHLSLQHYRSNAFSTNPIIADFDGNGVNEILYSQLDSICSIEYVKDSEKFCPPSEIRGWSLSKDEYYIEWKKPKNSLATQIWESSIYGAFADVLLAETADSVCYLQSWRENPGVIYFKSVYADGVVSYSSKQYLFVIKDAAKPVSALYSDQSSNLKISFSGKIANSVEPVIFKVIAGADTLIPTSAQFLNDYGYLLTFENPLSAGDYSVEISSFFDAYSNPTESGTLYFSVSGQSVVPDSIYLTRLVSFANDFSSVELFFSHPIGESATDAANYELRPCGLFDRVEKNSDSSVKIFFEPSNGIGAFGKEYLITAKNIFSEDGSMAITKGEGNTLAFVFTTDQYNDAYVFPHPVRLSGDAVAHFANIPKFASIEIYTLDGEQLNSLTEKNGTGGVEWNLRDSKGNMLNSGIYLFKVKDENGNSSDLKKLVIVR